MLNCERTETFRIPLKTCSNYTIDHVRFQIFISLEWVEKGGDNPNLIVSVTDKNVPTQPNFAETFVPHFPQRQTALPTFTNTVHHYQQQQHPRQQTSQINPPPRYPAQRQYRPFQNLMVLPNPTARTTNVQDDVSSTTIIGGSSAVQPVPLSFGFQQPPMASQPHLPTQATMHTLSTSAPPTNPLPSIQYMAPTASCAVGLPQGQTPSRAIVCKCSTPNVRHENRCQVHTLTQKCLLTPVTVHPRVNQQPMAPYASLIRLPSAKVMPPAKVPEQPSNAQQTSPPSQHYPNPMHPMLVMNNPSAMISQQLPHMSDSPAALSHQPSEIRHEPNNIYQPLDNNNASIAAESVPQKPATPMDASESTSPNLQPSPMPTDATPVPSSSPVLQRSPIQLNHNLFTTSDSARRGSPVAIAADNSQRQSFSKTFMVRSPVKLDISMTGDPHPATPDQSTIERIVDEVSKGKGEIRLQKSEMPSPAQQRSSSRLTSDSTESLTNRIGSPCFSLNFSPSNHHQGACSSAPTTQRKSEVLPQQNSASQEKRKRPESISKAGRKRNQDSINSVPSSATSAPNSSSETRSLPPSTSSTPLEQMSQCDTNDDDITENDLLQHLEFLSDGHDSLATWHNDPHSDLFNVSALFPSLPLSDDQVTALLFATDTRILPRDLDVYDNFFSTLPISSSQSQENQVTSSVKTPPELQPGQIQQQQQSPPYCSG